MECIKGLAHVPKAVYKVSLCQSQVASWPRDAKWMWITTHRFAYSHWFWTMQWYSTSSLVTKLTTGNIPPRTDFPASWFVSYYCGSRGVSDSDGSVHGPEGAAVINQIPPPLRSWVSTSNMGTQGGYLSCSPDEAQCFIWTIDGNLYTGPQGRVRGFRVGRKSHW